MLKSIGRRILTMDQLPTLLTEVEACLNTRPLTYQETDYKDTLLSLRPIDFIQNEIDITLSLTNFEESQGDPSYYPSSEAARLSTRLQTIGAPQSSCALSESYWRIWKDVYLTALREQHRRHMSKKRGCNRQPTIGTVVLIMDSCPVLRYICGTNNRLKGVATFKGKNIPWLMMMQ
ncbi:hypothetical protein NECAME_05369 [Necator americanus]|uniref:DUF5641 domain-containing protein n=1 Tax=Necator americanus TaxID=51031 RepID=W2SK82_NECAM|nr:hypothetical protein NECAME_05369 [Necator americanus]ETN69152.1 hypothetical protein NECAME_05369 [Necator americanus]